MEKISFNKEQLQYIIDTLPTVNSIISFGSESPITMEFEMVKEELLVGTPISFDGKSIQITLCGRPLLIDVKNFNRGRKKHFTWDEAMKIAKSQGKRLLTVEEMEELIKLPTKWDDEKEGMWFGDLFFPACGYYDYTERFNWYKNGRGYYWGASGEGEDRDYLYFFDDGFSCGHSSPYDSCEDTFCVRLVQDIL